MGTNNLCCVFRFCHQGYFFYLGLSVVLLTLLMVYLLDKLWMTFYYIYIIMSFIIFVTVLTICPTRRDLCTK